MSTSTMDQSQNSGGSSEREPQRQIARAALVQKLMANTPNLPAFLQDLITVQAVMVVGTEAAGFVVEPHPEKGFDLKPVVHIRPDNSAEDVRNQAMQAFLEIVRPCVQQGQDGAIQIGATEDQIEPQFCLVTLLRSDANVVAVSAVITRCRDVNRAKQRLESMQLVAGYFDMYSLRRNVEQARSISQNHQHVLQLATSVSTSKGFKAAVTNLCNEMAARTKATRVSIGWVKKTLKGEHRNKLVGMSHTEEFDKKQELAQQVMKVMDECLDQEEIVQYESDGSGTNNVSRESQALSRMNGGNSILSLPLRQGEEIIGVMTLEFSPQTKLGPQAGTALAVASELLAPQLYDRYQNDRYLITKAGISVKELTKKIIGPKYMIAKLIAALLIGLLTFISVYSPMYKVSAPFTLVAVEKRELSAPVDGYILRVHAKPGERVKAGQPLLEIEGTELRMQLAEARAQLTRAEREAERYRSEGKLAEMRVAQADAEQARAKVALIEYQISKLIVSAPLDGLVVYGDWADKIGAPVRLGDKLFEVSKLGELRVELTVNERDATFLRLDGSQRGELAISSLPQEKFPFKVDRVVPLPNPQSSGNTFRVYGSIVGQSDLWLPGMQGEAKIDVEEKSLLWSWTHRLIDFIRLKLWI